MRFLLLFLWCFPSLSRAEVTTDNELWLGVGAKLDVTEDLDVEFTQHLRWFENAATLESVMPELGVGYGLFSWLSLASSYRAISEKKDEAGMQRGRRLAASGQLERGLGPVALSARCQWQQKRMELEANAGTRLRYRGQVGLDTSTMIRPLVAYELFADPAAEREERAQKSRVTAGFGLKLSKTHRIKFKYHHQLELDGDGDVERIFVLGYRAGLSLK